MLYEVAANMFCPPWEGAMRAAPYNLDLYGLFNINLETKLNLIQIQI